jgi:hypothetical protein
LTTHEKLKADDGTGQNDEECTRESRQPRRRPAGRRHPAGMTRQELAHFLTDGQRGRGEPAVRNAREAARRLRGEPQNQSTMTTGQFKRRLLANQHG